MDRYALDGHAPPSIGGLLGCMGLFETPRGDRPISGAVGMRSLKPRYVALLGRPAASLLVASVAVAAAAVVAGEDSEQHHEVSTAVQVDQVATGAAAASSTPARGEAASEQAGGEADGEGSSAWRELSPGEQAAMVKLLAQIQR
jgi:hypothetical protein